MNQKLLLPIFAIVVLLFAWMTLFGGLFTPDPHEVSLAVGGDVMLTGNIPAVLNESESAFKGVSNVTSAADLLLFNFDNVATYSDNAVKHDNPKKYQPRFTDLVHGNDNTIVALANEHSLDYGVSGMRDTISSLNEAKIAYLGVGEDENQSHQGITREINGRTISIFNYMDPGSIGNYSYDEVPFANGLAPGYSAYNSNVAQKQISQAKEAGDFVIVYMHFGDELSNSSDDNQKRIAHELIAYGADIVFGSNPQIPQGIEMYDGRPIFYSLGEFVSDSYLENTQDSYFVNVNLSGESCECTLYPIHLKDGIPYFSEPNDGNSLLNSLSPRCYELQINNGIGKLQFNLTDGDEN